MRALFSSWCDEYYNLRIHLIGENLHKIWVQSDNRASAKRMQKLFLAIFIRVRQLLRAFATHIRCFNEQLHLYDLHSLFTYIIYSRVDV